MQDGRGNSNIQTTTALLGGKEDVEANAASFRELCQNLSANDKSTTTVTIGDTHITDQRAVEIGNALFNNTVVNKVTFDLRYLHKFGGSVFCFLDYLQFAASLVTVELKNAGLRSEAVSCTVTVLLDAISQNSSVRDLTLDSKLSAEQAFSAHFLRKSKELAEKVLKIPECNSKSAALQIATALAKCVGLESVWMEHLDEVFLCRMLGALQQLPALQAVAVVPKHYCVDTFNLLGGLLLASQSLQQIELHSCRLTAKRLDPVIAGLIESQSAAEISLHDCRFDRPATAMMEELFTANKTSIKTLTIGFNVKFARPVATVLNTILMKSSCSLSGLNLRYHDLGNGILELLSTLEECEPIERLAVGHINTEEQLEALKHTVSDLGGLREITVDLCPNLWDQHEELLDAFKCNASIEQCVIDEEVFKFVERKKKKKKNKEKKAKDGKAKKNKPRRESTTINENLISGVLSMEEMEQIKQNRTRLLDADADHSEFDQSMRSVGEDVVQEVPSVH